jgi:hypothetical protein
MPPHALGQKDPVSYRPHLSLLDFRFIGSIPHGSRPGARKIPAGNCGHRKVAAKLRAYFGPVINSAVVAAALSLKQCSSGCSIGTR